MKIKSVAKNGTFTFALAVNSVIEARVFNMSDTASEYKIELLRDNNAPVQIDSGELAPKATQNIKIFAQTGDKIIITASEETNTLLNILQELSLARGVLNRQSVDYIGDGVSKSFRLPDNAPANNHLEVSVLIDGFYSPKYGDEWELSEDKTELVFKVAPYNGADIKIKLHKWE